jgi:hypothetical protein
MINLLLTLIAFLFTLGWGLLWQKVLFELESCPLLLRVLPIPKQVHQYCQQWGWREPYWRSGRYWAFPPNAVQPLPLPLHLGWYPYLADGEFAFCFPMIWTTACLIALVNAMRLSLNQVLPPLTASLSPYLIQPPNLSQATAALWDYLSLGAWLGVVELVLFGSALGAIEVGSLLAKLVFTYREFTFELWIAKGLLIVVALGLSLIVPFLVLRMALLAWG